MGAPRACLIFITFQLLSLAYAQDLYKRMPQGFLGMRGKKYFDDENSEQFYKRKPQFFVGVKGKKTLQDILDIPEEYYKPASSGFTGTRDKKDLKFPDFGSNEVLAKRDGSGSLIGQIDYTSSENPHLADLSILNELLMQYLYKVNYNPPTTNSYVDIVDTDLDHTSNEIEKRSAKIHQFFGVRGKKSMNNKRPYDLTFRGKFIGVRGKKDQISAGPQEIKFLVNQNGPLPKRKAQMGFFGMRGKKWTDDQSSPEEMMIPN